MHCMMHQKLPSQKPNKPYIDRWKQHALFFKSLIWLWTLFVNDDDKSITSLNMKFISSFDIWVSGSLGFLNKELEVIIGNNRACQGAQNKNIV